MSYLDRQLAFVIDFGHAITKLGFASEYRPRHFIATPELQPIKRPSEISPIGWQYSALDEDVPEELVDRIDSLDFTVEKDGQKVPVQPKESTICCGRSTEDWLKILHPLLSKIFLHYLKSPPKERRVIILDNTLSSRHFRDALTQVLFSRFHIAAVCFLPAQMAPLYLTCSYTGLVVDCGYETTRILPIEAERTDV